MAVTGKNQTNQEQAHAVQNEEAPKDVQTDPVEREEEAVAQSSADEGASESLSKALADAEQELVQHRDAMLRMQAEMENLRKRLMRDQEKSRKFALERIMKDLLQVRDTLERGLEMSNETTTLESMREGKALTLRMLTKVMEDHHLEIIDPAGESFNPEFHEAMTVIPSEDHEENTVMEVVQKGFRLHDRLIRPAMVVVSGKP
jgi:molecular chaperone GrpE